MQKDGIDNDLIQVTSNVVNNIKEKNNFDLPIENLPQIIEELEFKMKKCAKDLDFEQAAKLRDQIHQLRKKLLK